uniref:Neprosin PEP catalytic domain-containing protein n=1 Tax=Oryza punctata TaxID=4537 RepID=A0A0E0K6A8_ORYPU
MDTKSPLAATDLQAQLSTIVYPKGTIPILHNNKVDIIVQRIGTLASNYVENLAAGIRYWDEIYGTWASINVYEPNQDLSASWIQIENRPKVGDGVGDGAVIGAGSFVSPSFSGDGSARFRIGWINEELNKSCIDHDCPGFVQVNHNVGDPKTKNWWLAYGSNNTLIGYWPSSQFSFIKDNGDFALWGGYVRGPTASSNRPEMGSGHFPSEGFQKAAFIRNIQIIKDESNMLVSMF